MQTFKNIIVSTISIDDLLISFREIVKEEIRHHDHNLQQEKLLSTTEVCSLLNITSVTLATWVKKDLIKKYTVGRKNLYKHSEIIESLRTLKKYKHNY